MQVHTAPAAKQNVDAAQLDSMERAFSAQHPRPVGSKVKEGLPALLKLLVATHAGALQEKLAGLITQVRC